MKTSEMEVGMLVEHRMGVGRIARINPSDNSVVLASIDGEREVTVPFSAITPQLAPDEEADWY